MEQDDNVKTFSNDDCKLCGNHKFVENTNKLRIVPEDLGLLPNGNTHSYVSQTMKQGRVLTCHICGEKADCKEDNYMFCLACWPMRYKDLICGTCKKPILSETDPSPKKRCIIDQNVINPDCKDCKLAKIYERIKNEGMGHLLPK